MYRKMLNKLRCQLALIIWFAVSISFFNINNSIIDYGYINHDGTILDLNDSLCAMQHTKSVAEAHPFLRKTDLDLT